MKQLEYGTPTSRLLALLPRLESLLIVALGLPLITVWEIRLVVSIIIKTLLLVGLVRLVLLVGLSVIALVETSTRTTSTSFCPFLYLFYLGFCCECLNFVQVWPKIVDLLGTSQQRPRKLTNHTIRVCEQNALLHLSIQGINLFQHRMTNQSQTFYDKTRQEGSLHQFKQGSSAIKQMTRYRICSIKFIVLSRIKFCHMLSICIHTLAFK